MTDGSWLGRDLGITPMSWGLAERTEAVAKARDLGAGVRMEVGSGATRYYTALNVPIGQIDVWMARTYKGQLEYATRLHSPDAFFDAFGFTWEDDEDDDD